MKENKNSKLIGCHFVLAVQDLGKSVDYYKDKLGFETWGSADGWHFVKRGDFRLMIGECTDEKPAAEIGNHSYFAYAMIEDADSLYEEYKSKEVDIISGINDKPWGRREFGIKTLDGHRITFGEEIKD